MTIIPVAVMAVLVKGGFFVAMAVEYIEAYLNFMVGARRKCATNALEGTLFLAPILMWKTWGAAGGVAALASVLIARYVAKRFTRGNS